MLNNWAPFTVILAGEFKNPKGEMEEFYHVVLQVPGFQTMEQFEGNLQECQEECHELNVRIGTSLSQHIEDESKTPDSVTLDPWGSLMGRNKKERNKKEMMIAMPATKKPKHTHFWEFHSWVKGPKSPKDNYQTWDFVVEYRCSCGKNQRVEPSQEELKQYIKDSMCDYCGELHEQHEQPRECIAVLRNKVVGLEERLEKLEDKMNSTRNVFKDSVDRDGW